MQAKTMPVETGKGFFFFCLKCQMIFKVDFSDGPRRAKRTESQKGYGRRARYPADEPSSQPGFRLPVPATSPVARNILKQKYKRVKLESSNAVLGVLDILTHNGM